MENLFHGHGKLFDHEEMEILFYDGKILPSNGDSYHDI